MNGKIGTIAALVCAATLRVAASSPFWVGVVDTAVFRLADSTASTAKYATLPVDSLRGWQVVLSGWASADSLTTRVLSWNGVKAMLIVKNADSTTSYPQLSWPTGRSFPHQRSIVRFRIPDDAKSVQVAYGLEKVAGVARVDSLAVIRWQWSSVASRDSNLAIPDFSPTRLRGAQIGVHPGLPAVATFGKDWKGNLLRWQFIGPESSLVKPQFDSLLADAMDNLDKYLPTCRANGIKVVLCMHNLSRGLFLSPQAQSKLIATWRILAARYRDKPEVWAYDLANEPDMNQWRENVMLWDDLADTLCRAVRAVDTGKVIVVESPMGDVTTWPSMRPVGWRRGYDLSKIVYSFHYYRPFTLTHQGIGPKYPPYGAVYPGVIENKPWNADTIRRDMKPALEFQRKYRVPMYVGEFSCVRWAADHSAIRWLSDVIPIWEDFGWDWTFHAYQEYDGWSVEYSDSLKDMRTPLETDRKALFLKYFAKNRDPYAPGATSLPRPAGLTLRFRRVGRSLLVTGLAPGTRLQLRTLSGALLWRGEAGAEGLSIPSAPTVGMVTIGTGEIGGEVSRVFVAP